VGCRRRGMKRDHEGVAARFEDQGLGPKAFGFFPNPWRAVERADHPIDGGTPRKGLEMVFAKLENFRPSLPTGSHPITLDCTPRIRKEAECLGPETLILEAGRDSFVIPFHPPATATHLGPQIIIFQEGRHELLMERESIRKPALHAILSFLESGDGRKAIPLDQRGGNRLSSENKPSIP